MAAIEIYRFGQNKFNTIGELYVNGEFCCYTLEDAYHAQKIWGQTRIPGGMYSTTLRSWGGFHAKYSRRFGKLHKGMIWLRNVPNFKYILIHIGNTHFDSAGCILVGSEYRFNQQEGWHELINSTAAYKKLYKKVVNDLINNNLIITIYDHSRDKKTA